MGPMGRWGCVAVATLLAATVLVGLAAGYGERVFNANPARSGSSYAIDAALGLPLTYNWAAQSFTPVEPFLLYNVTLYVQNQGADVLNVTIQGDGGGSPDGSAIAFSQRARSGTGWLDFLMTPRPTLAANTKYWIVAVNGQLTGNGYRWFHANRDAVPGEAKVNTGTGWSQPDVTDMTFIAYGLRLEPLVSVGLAQDRRSAAPGESFAYTVNLNNTGSRPAPDAWVNMTLPTNITRVSDTAASIGGTRIGPSAWHVAPVANGPNAFTVTAMVIPAAGGGQFLSATVHLDYTDSAGRSQPSSSASATIFIAAKTKPLYLWHDRVVGTADELRAAAPIGGLEDFDGDLINGSTISGTTLTWTLTPALARPFHIRGPVKAEMFLDGANPNDSGTINVTLFDRRGPTSTAFAWAQVAVTVDATAGFFQSVTLDLGIADRLQLQGNVTELWITKVAGANLYLAYNSTDTRSHVDVTTDTYIAITSVAVADNRGPATIFSAKDDVNVFVNASDPLGSGAVAAVGLG